MWASYKQPAAITGRCHDDISKWPPPSSSYDMPLFHLTEYWFMCFECKIYRFQCELLTWLFVLVVNRFKLHFFFFVFQVAGQVASIRSFCHRTSDVSSQEPYSIYKGSLSTQIKALKTFSVGTSMIGMAMQPMLYQVNDSKFSSISSAKVLFIFFYSNWAHRKGQVLLS